MSFSTSRILRVSSLRSSAGCSACWGRYTDSAHLTSYSTWPRMSIIPPRTCRLDSPPNRPAALFCMTQTICSGVHAHTDSFTLTLHSRLLVFYIAAYFTVVDYKALLESSFPSIVGAVYLEATHNKAVTLVLLIIVLAPAFFACFCYFLANIRLLYGFTRAGAGKFSPTRSLHPGSNPKSDQSNL